jgi:hypothetical protein
MSTYLLTLSDGSSVEVDSPVRSIRRQVVARDARGRVRTLSAVALTVSHVTVLLGEPMPETDRLPVSLPESARIH